MSAPAEPGLQEFAANRLLALLPETECERIARHLEPSVLDASHVLQHESTAIEHVYFPARGVVASTLMVPDAADVTVSIVGREGALFSDAAAPVGRSLIRATVRSPGMIEVIDRFALEATACECYGTIRSRREEFERRFAGEPADINPSAGHEGAEAAF